MRRPTDDLVLAYFVGGVFASLERTGGLTEEQQSNLDNWTDRCDGQVGIIQEAISAAAFIEKEWNYHCYALAHGCLHGYFEVFEPLGSLWVEGKITDGWTWESAMHGPGSLAERWIEDVPEEDRKAMAKAVAAFIQELRKLER